MACVNSSVVVWAAGAVWATWATAALGQVATFTALGDLPGGQTISYAEAVSADGTVVVGQAYDAVGQQPVFWIGGVMQVLPKAAGFNTGFAVGVSGDGSVIVGQSSLNGGSLTGRATRWDAGVPTNLGVLAGATLGSTANAVSRDGLVIGGWSKPSTGYRAFRWTGGVMSPLDDIPSGFDDAAVNKAISADGSILGGRGVTAAAGSSLYEACVWAPGPSATALGDLPGGRDLSEVYGINGPGTVFVGMGNSSSATILTGLGEACRWVTGGPAQSLGDLPGGSFTSAAMAVSDDGRVIVGYGTTLAGREASVWTLGHGMVRLQDALVSRWGLTLPVEWSKLTNARGLTPDGTTLVGDGVRNGNIEGWMVTVPCWFSPDAVVASPTLLVHCPGKSLTLRVVGGGAGTRTYQWRRDGVPISAAANPTAVTDTLVTSDFQVGLGWVFDCLVTNECGTTESPDMVVLVDANACCRPDLTASAVAGSFGYGAPNGTLNSEGFFYYLSQFGAGNVAVADLTASASPGSVGYGVPNGVLNSEDYFYYLTLYAAGC